MNRLWAVFLALLFVFLFPSPVGYEADLRMVAEDKLADLVRTNHWEHTNSNGCDFGCRVEGYDNYVWIGENLYRRKGECDIAQAYRMWEDSPSHLSVLLKDADEEVLLEGSNGEYCYLVLVRGVTGYIP